MWLLGNFKLHTVACAVILLCIADINCTWRTTDPQFNFLLSVYFKYLILKSILTYFALSVLTRSLFLFLLALDFDVCLFQTGFHILEILLVS